MVSPVLSLDVDASCSESGTRISREEDRTVVWLSGAHDLVTVSAVTAALASAVSQDHADVIVDLSGVTFIDAVTTEVLTRCKRLLQAHTRGLVLRAPSPATRILLEVHGLVDLVEPEA